MLATSPPSVAPPAPALGREAQPPGPLLRLRVHVPGLRERLHGVLRGLGDVGADAKGRLVKGRSVGRGSWLAPPGGSGRGLAGARPPPLGGDAQRGVEEARQPRVLPALAGRGGCCGLVNGARVAPGVGEGQGAAADRDHGRPKHLGERLHHVRVAALHGHLRGAAAPQVRRSTQVGRARLEQRHRRVVVHAGRRSRAMHDVPAVAAGAPGERS